MKNLILLSLLLISNAFASLQFEAVFNEPGLHGEATTTIEDRFVKLLDQAVPGSEVLLNIYGLRIPYIATELLKAQARGVKIGVILRKFGDEHSKQSLDTLTKGTDGLTALGECEFGKCLKVCGLACSAPAFNHNKFYLFSELADGTKNVVVHTSNNFWDEERFNFNDFLIIKNNKELFDALRTYWITLYKGKQNPKLDEQITDTIKLHIFPKAILGKKDRVEQLFRKVKCVPGSFVHIAHSRFTDPRSSIADALVDLKKQGCDVKFLIKNDLSFERLGPIKFTGDSPGPKVIKKLGDILYVYPYEEPVNGRPFERGDPKRNALHSKIIIINAPMGDDPTPKKLVVVGTHNMDVPSHKLNNEIMMEIEDDGLFQTYEGVFQRLLTAYLDLSLEDRIACPKSGCVVNRDGL